MATQVRFNVEDAAAIRFGISPLWETLRSLYALGDPGRYAIHLPWIRRARQLARERSLLGHVDVLKTFARPGVWMPDFLTPPPAGPLVELEDELEIVLRTPTPEVVADLAATAAGRTTAVTRAALHEPQAVLEALVEAARAWHDAAIKPQWPRIRALLEADIAFRSRQLVEGGARQLFDTLHPTVRWADDRLVCDDPWNLDLDLRGRGLPLIPSAFVDRRVLWNVRADPAPVAVYPARAAATLWDRPRPTSGGLAAVLGATRAHLLELLRGPATTTELARRLALSPAAVSQHLRALHNAGLLTRSPNGRVVLYAATEPALALLRIQEHAG
ncbi:metalloregulator ArsR/SmtB family transcription factor [Asanoa sp. NPDC049573]|uniref:metalloregulator ArsR/SmtB family transcription factor n=1 Tax=Asanoa sp. NPDC049573 TaxID=3155396 RepID=UPI003415C165